MRRALLLLALVGCASPAPDPQPSTPAVVVETAPPEPQPDAFRPQEVWTDTGHVEAMILHRGHVWVATRGGVERYRLDGSERALFTTDEGLDAVHVRDLRVEGDTVVAITERSRCTFDAERFECRASSVRVAPPETQGFFRGRRVTAALEVDGERLVGTAGVGVWLTGAEAPLRWTPDQQVCGPHITSLAFHDAALWIGTFHQGICRRTEAGFEAVPAPFAMVNEVASTPAGLFVAASEGLFHWRDEAFHRIDLGRMTGAATSLAWHRDHLLVTTIDSLWRVELGTIAQTTRFWKPAGSTSLQAVATRGDVVWLASEDRGAIAFDGRDRFVAHDATRGLPASWALDVAATEDGGAYLATLRDGLFRVEPDGSPRRVAEGWMLRAEHVGKGLAVGTQEGASLLRHGNLRPLEGLPDPRVHAFFSDGADLWVGTERGLARYALRSDQVNR